MQDFDLRAEWIAPALDAREVTPSDATDLLDAPCRSLYVGGAGNITVDMASGRTVLFTAVPAGTILPIMVRRVRATGTTATGIDALY